jgi:DNA-binding transcriptional MocR family regulator
LPDNGLGTEAVYRRVREAILEGEIAPGATMSQVSLADEPGISRMPLREALRMLQTEGLVEAERNRPRAGRAGLRGGSRGARGDARHASRRRRSGCPCRA